MKSIFVIIFALLPMLLHAGVILKKSGERIEDIRIKQVSDVDVIYISDNGEEISIPKIEVSAILYDDGRYEEIKTPKVDVTAEEKEPDVIKYKEDNETAKQLEKEQKAREAEERKQQQAAAKAAALEKARMEEEQAKIAEEQARLAQEQEYQADGLIHRTSADSWYYIDRYYTKKEINSIILTDCPDAKAQYDNGHKLMVSGWSLVGVSCAMVITGGIVLGVGGANYWEKYWVPEKWVDLGYGYGYWDGGYYVDRRNESASTLVTAGIILMSASAGVFITGLTIACIGHHRMNNTYKIFNSSCANKQVSSLSLSFGTTRNGIGLSLHF